LEEELKSCDNEWPTNEEYFIDLQQQMKIWKGKKVYNGKSISIRKKKTKSLKSKWGIDAKVTNDVQGNEMTVIHCNTMARGNLVYYLEIIN